MSILWARATAAKRRIDGLSDEQVIGAVLLAIAFLAVLLILGLVAILQPLPAAVAAAPIVTPTPSRLARVAAKAGQLLCAMRGHDPVLSFDHAMRLTCSSCGWQSPGIQPHERPPRHRFDGDPTRHAMKAQLWIVRKRA